MEAVSSALVKDSSRRLDLGLRPDRRKFGDGIVDAHYVASQPERSLVALCAAHRMPPATPEAVKHSLETEKKFTNKGDTDVVAGLYRSLFETVVPALETYVAKELSWGADDLATFAEVAKRMSNCTTLECAACASCPLPQLACSLRSEHSRMCVSQLVWQRARSRGGQCGAICAVSDGLADVC